MALYNKLTKQERKPIDCLNCPRFNLKLKKCEGLGKICFELDTKTNTIYDLLTGLPVSEKELQND